jgi:transitional endoplasmic reticulum ATPase
MSDLKSVLRRNFVDIVKNRQMARMYDITPPNGILLYGAPGCGKTFVAEKAAQESGLKYKIINPSDFASIYIHGSQSKIAEAFKEAEKNAPMILIFDEFDAIAPKRDADNNNQANEVNEMLTQLNNCASKGIFVLATTNRPDMIDSACLRAGRMDEKFYVGLPDTDARKEIFAMELKKRPCDDDIDLELLGNATSDFTCGDISYIVKETARRCFDEAIHNGDGSAVPLTTEKLLEVAKNTIPSVSPKDIRLYMDLKDKMEHRDKENKSRGRVGFSTNA